MTKFCGWSLVVDYIIKLKKKKPNDNNIKGVEKVARKAFEWEGKRFDFAHSNVCQDHTRVCIRVTRREF
jgi:hypothetical protein